MTGARRIRKDFDLSYKQKHHLQTQVVFYNMWGTRGTFLQTAYMADEIMAPRNARQCFHGQQAEAEHNDEEQRIKAELLR